jgi:hypothetical protein
MSVADMARKLNKTKERAQRKSGVARAEKAPHAAVELGGHS